MRRLPGHVAADEPYYLLEEEGYEFGFPPSPEDYRALLARSVLSLASPPSRPEGHLRPDAAGLPRLPGRGRR